MGEPPPYGGRIAERRVDGERDQQEQGVVNEVQGVGRSIGRGDGSLARAAKLRDTAGAVNAFPETI
ncbi:hypothetical protein GCM10008179_11550 [Hansschlegelia plantiphila]|uniref:Uncharacterized protein n=1 Tax=Hansschlegelia plantiphila TaxID=374655 RepID=A0A9W6IYS2_9HYPH|nr:hypothetical protein GCM10008179_11550 [Hansschlegelia plantiphila]